MNDYTFISKEADERKLPYTFNAQTQVAIDNVMSFDTGARPITIQSCKYFSVEKVTCDAYFIDGAQALESLGFVNLLTFSFGQNEAVDNKQFMKVTAPDTQLDLFKYFWHNLRYHVDENYNPLVYKSNNLAYFKVQGKFGVLSTGTLLVSFIVQGYYWVY